MSAPCVYCGDRPRAAPGPHEDCDRNAEALGRVVYAARVAALAARRGVEVGVFASWDDRPEVLRDLDRRIGMAVARAVWS